MNEQTKDYIKRAWQIAYNEPLDKYRENNLFFHLSSDDISVISAILLQALELAVEDVG